MRAPFIALARSHSRQRAFLPLVATAVTVGLLVPAHAAGSAYPLRFARVQEYPLTDTETKSVAIGDVTGDHRKDVVVSTGSWSNPQNQWKVIVYRQQADGSLAEPARFSPVWKVAVQGVAIGDLNRDHRNDVALATALGVNIFRQRNGTLARPFFIPRTVGAYDVEIADLNRDGRNDLVVRGGTWVRIAWNRRRGFQRLGRDQKARVRGRDRGRHRRRAARPRRRGLRRQAPRVPTAARRDVRSSGRAPHQSGRVGDRGCRLDRRRPQGRRRRQPGLIEVLAQTRAGTLKRAGAQPGIDSPAAIEALDMNGDHRVDLVTGNQESAGVVLEHSRHTLDGVDWYLVGRAR